MKVQEHRECWNDMNMETSLVKCGWKIQWCEWSAVSLLSPESAGLKYIVKEVHKTCMYVIKSSLT